MIPKLAITTSVHNKLQEAFNTGLYNVFVMQGSSRSSKTHSIIQFWIKYAWVNRGNRKRVAVCRLRGTWLSATVLYDFVNVLTAYGLYDKKNHNKTNKIYTLWDTEFWFMGLDDPQRVHGFSSDAFWINEAIEAGYDDYAQLMQRCTGFAILDYNPSETEHWIYDRILKRKKTWYNHSTFRDNRFISKNAKEQILGYEPTEENYASGTADVRKWKIYGLGQPASLEGLIYENFEIIKDLPDWKPSHHEYGLDFGYTNDPTAIIDSYWGDVGVDWYLDEMCYKTHLMNPDVGKEIKDCGLAKTKGWADCAEPKSIDEINAMGTRLEGVSKVQKKHMIDIVKRRKLKITERSVNTIREIKKYTWQQDKNGIWLNEPCDGDDHAMDAMGYIATMRFQIKKKPKNLAGRVY